MKTALWIIALCEIIRITQGAERNKILRMSILADERRKKAIAKLIKEKLDEC